MQPLLDLKNIHKTYGTGEKAITALKGVSFSIYPGEIVGLLGVNGAGKTTVSSIIATLHPATSGEVIFNGSSIYDNLLAYRQVLGFCPQKPNVDKDLTIYENLWYAGHFYGLPEAVIEQRIQELLQQFELAQYADHKPEVLSGGYKQRLLIARALIHKPKLIILDEPTVGLDPHIRRQLWDVIRSVKQQGMTVLLTTHYLDEAEYLSDRVIVMDKGLVRVIDTPANLLKMYNKTRLEDVFLHLMEQN